MNTSFLGKWNNFIFILKRLTGSVGNKSMDPGTENRKEKVRDCTQLFFLLILLQRDGQWRLETTAPSLPVYSEILSWRRCSVLSSRRKRLKPEGRGSRGEKRRRAVLSRRVCGMSSKFMYSWFRERTVSVTRVIVNVSAMDTSVVTQGHTLWNKWWNWCVGECLLGSRCTWRQSTYSCSSCPDRMATYS